jgi:hypothetical protein
MAMLGTTTMNLLQPYLAFGNVGDLELVGYRDPLFALDLLKVLEDASGRNRKRGIREPFKLGAGQRDMTLRCRAGIDRVFKSARFRLVLETIDNRANGVRLIGLVLELEFHGKTWTAAACCRFPGASLLARGGWGEKGRPLAAVLSLFIGSPQQAAGMKAAAGCRSPRIILITTSPPCLD